MREITDEMIREAGASVLREIGGPALLAAYMWMETNGKESAENPLFTGLASAGLAMQLLQSRGVENPTYLDMCMALVVTTNEKTRELVVADEVYGALYRSAIRPMYDQVLAMASQPVDA